jgi:hypothetical protein
MRSVIRPGLLTVLVRGEAHESAFEGSSFGRAVLQGWDGRSATISLEVGAHDAHNSSAHGRGHPLCGRPIGSVAIGHDEGAYTMVMYFTSEAEAREGERKEPPPELQVQMEEMNKLNIGEPEFFDLKQPILSSPD